MVGADFRRNRDTLQAVHILYLKICNEIVVQRSAQRVHLFFNFSENTSFVVPGDDGKDAAAWRRRTQ
jgi:hypothetical protein